jgi:HAD superfamily hydrolase (TIGR01509 family)
MSERVVLFDMMGTLVHDPFFVEIPAFFRTDLRTLVRRKHPTAWVDFELGTIDEAELGRRFFDVPSAGEPKAEMDVAGLKAAMVDAYRWLPGIPPLLEQLKARGVAMHVLSNYPCWYQLIEDKLGVSRYLPWTFVSCNTGTRKPDAVAYTSAAASLGVPCDACLFVDDRGLNCDGARAVGMDAIEFTDADALGRELHARGLI